jgi:hypothetical protein
LYNPEKPGIEQVCHIRLHYKRIFSRLHSDHSPRLCTCHNFLCCYASFMIFCVFDLK